MTPGDPKESRLPPRLSPASLFRGKLAVGISNPKLILLAAASLPQFVDPARPQSLQFETLVGSSATVECFWYSVYAMGGRSLARYLE